MQSFLFYQDTENSSNDVAYFFFSFSSLLIEKEVLTQKGSGGDDI